MIALLLENIMHYDEMIFHKINTGLANPFFDAVFPLLRDKYFWIPLYSFILLFAFFNHKIKAYWFVLFLILCVGISDVISHRVIKQIVKRERPCRNPDIQPVRTLVSCGGGYSFTSNHAANHFALSMFIIFVLGARHRVVKIWLFLWAFVVSFAQVYVGVHYPLDVLGGGGIGFLVAIILFSLYKKVTDG